MSEITKDLFCLPVFERVLLAYCFKNVANYYTISSNISDGDFLHPRHRMIWMMLGMLSERGATKFDGSMVINEAQKSGILSEIGGYEYVNAIIGLNVNDKNIQYYIDRILDSSTKYRLHLSLRANLEKLESTAKDNDVTSADMLSKVSGDVMQLDIESKAVREATNLSDGMDEYLQERKDNPIEFCGLRTGFDILDSRIDGLVPSTLTVFCARPKHGKSTFLATISQYIAYQTDDRKAVLYVDTEMPFDQFRPRLLSILSGVPERRIKHGGYTNDEWLCLKRAADIIKKGKLFHEYLPGYSVDKLQSIYKKYKHREDIGLAVFDYIKAPPGADFRNKKEYQILGDVTTALKDLSGQLDIPVLCANQINRQQDIADSDRILRYADVIMIFRPKTFEEVTNEGGLAGGRFKLMITDSRRGGTTPEEGIGYDFIKSSLQISEAEEQAIDYFSKEYKEKEDMMYEDNGPGETNESTDSERDDNLF